MNRVEAIALDEQHLELTKPFPLYIGKRFFIRVLSPILEQSHELKKLEKAYSTMSKEEKKREVELVEKGLQFHPELSEQFPDEKEE